MTQIRAIFADSGYWIALWNPRDNLHTKAVRVADGLGITNIVTTQMVLTEALDAMAGMGTFRIRLAIRMLHALETDAYMGIIPQTDAQFRAAVERYASRSDQCWSLTDCASFLAMEERDFEQGGFVALLREG